MGAPCDRLEWSIRLDAILSAVKRLHGISTMFAVAAFASSAVAANNGLATKATIQLSSALDGFNGQLVLLEDARLTAGLDKLLWGSGGPEMALDPSDPLSKELTSSPLRPAVLRLLDDHSNKVDEVKLERELARVEAAFLHPGRRTILITTDLSAGFGSYSGPSTRLVEINGGKLVTIKARDARSGELGPVRLAMTLKTAWKLVPAGGKSSSDSRDILEVECRPDPDASIFYTTYVRYHWNGGGWVRFSRRARGTWEADESFPPLSMFR